MSVLAALESRIREQPQRPALRMLADENGPALALTYGQLGARLTATANYLRRIGLRAGDRLALQLPKGLSFILLHWAALRLGAISLPLNPAYPQAELAYYLRDAGARFFIRGPQQPPCPPDLPELERAFAIEPDEIPHLADDATQSISIAAPHPRLQDAAVMIYTSGTTGRPKGALLTHGNLAANAAALHEAWRWRRADTLLHVLPLFHVHGLFVALQGALYAGAEARLRRRFDAAATLTDLRSGAYSVFMAVPAIHARLLEQAEEESAATSFRSMRLMTSGSDRLPDAVFDQFEQRLGYRLLERYGMTETGMNLSNPLQGERRRGSVGQPLPGVAARIVDRQSGIPPARGRGRRAADPRRSCIRRLLAAAAADGGRFQR